ncbi:MAG: hypothetical protein AAF389_14750 [Gemmatimonadota bacterium]
MSYRIHGRRTETIVGEGATPVEAMENYWKLGGTDAPEWMDEGDDENGIPVIGRCESCGGPVLVTEKRFWDDDGVMWHQACPR